MSYTNVNGAPTAGSLSSNDQAALKAYIGQQQAGGGRLVGVTDPGQIASVLNAPIPIPNPQPAATTTATSMPRTAVLSFLASAIVQARLANPPVDTALTILQDLQASVQGNPLDPIPVSDINAFTASVKTAGLDLTAQVAAQVTSTDPGWPAQAMLSPWPLWGLSVAAYLTAADVTAALAS